MIRETLAPQTKFVHMIVTPFNRTEWMPRASTDELASGTAVDNTPAPHWVRITRSGNTFTGEHSADGTTWETIVDPIEIEMSQNAYAGLVMCSHVDGTLASADFNNVTITGDVTAEPASIDIGSNSAESIYVALEDLTGAAAVVAHPYAAATQIAPLRNWTIPLSDFAGVDPTMASKLYVGVGNGEPGGFGSITVSDIKVVEAVVLGDITQPGDIVQGVPNDGDWPANESPPNAIDNNVNTKYLHFKGGSMATGFRVTPLDGPSVVTGLTLTTANDDYGRDPTSFELYGSMESIDGPYELIAAGDIVDFAGEALWPRFTKNETPITFANQMAYAHYQLLFPDVSRPNNDGLMQIAEVELLGEITQPRTLTISSTNGGSVPTPGEGSFIYADGVEVEVNTAADEYYFFQKWMGSAVDAGKVADPYSANTTVLMDGDYSLKASFGSVNFSLTASSTAGGSVTKPCEGKFIIGGNFLIPLEAEADPHYHFLYWTGSAVDAEMVFHPDNPIASVLVLGNYTVVANFATDTHTLTISSTAGGSVTTPGEGAMVYDYGTVVDLVATADEHYHFVSWTGTAVDAGKVADPYCASTTVVVEGDYTLIANFEIDNYILTICSIGGGCVTTPGEGMFEYACGTVVDLVATPDDCYRFKFWIGPVADPQSASTTVTITEDITVVAVFVKKLCPPEPCPEPDPDP